MDGLGQVMVPGQEPLSLPHRLLEKAVIDGSETIRLDVMQLACLHPKSTAFPGEKNCCAVLESRPCHCSKIERLTKSIIDGFWKRYVIVFANSNQPCHTGQAGNS